MKTMCLIKPNRIYIFFNGPQKSDRMICSCKFNQLRTNSLILKEIIHIKFNDLAAFNMYQPFYNPIIIYPNAIKN